MSKPKNILVIRNDKLGDFMLAWPSFQRIKQLFPDSVIYALVPEYTSPMAKICPWIDKVVLDDASDGISGIIKTASKIKPLHIDAAICFHSTPRIALALFLAKISNRFAPASRIDQILYNHTLTQRRSRSEKPEYEYNIDLASFMGKYFGEESFSYLKAPFLSFQEDEIEKIKHEFCIQHNISKDRKLIFIHAGTGGSAINLSIEQYAKLIHLLAKNPSLFFVLTAGPGEEANTENLSALISDCDHSIHYSNKGLVAFSKLIATADIFISGSTGTLHIAGALNIATVAFYPARRSATPLRWQTLNSEENRICFSPDVHKGEDDMSRIDIAECAREILLKYL